jgi:hypothetical protein
MTNVIQPVEGEPIQKRLLVIGSPRSGTGYFTRVLNAWGMRVCHERMGEDGIVNCTWLMRRFDDDPLMIGKGRQHYQFEKIIHLVRNPLKCIDSLNRDLSRQFWDWQILHSGIEVVPGCMETYAAFWLYWTDGCERGSDERVRLEDIQHLGQRRNQGMSQPRDLKLEHLGSMADEVEHRMMMYGYEPGMVEMERIRVAG